MQRWMPSAAWLMVMVTTAFTWAADVEVILTPPRDPASGGDTILLNLYLHNHGGAESVVDLPPQLPCIVATKRTTLNLSADLRDGAEGARVAVPGGGFALRQYRLRLPVFAAGAVRAAVWLQNKPNGLYTMQDVLGLKD